MKNNSLGTKLLMAAVTLALLLYFGFQAVNYFSDPLSTTLAYTYRVEVRLITDETFRMEDLTFVW